MNQLVIEQKERKRKRRFTNVALLCLRAVGLCGCFLRFTGGFVFTDDLGHPVKPNRAWRRFKVACAKAGIPEADQVRFHDLKHMTVSHLIAAGNSIEQVAKFVGHSSTWMTDRYHHLATDEMDKVADSLR